MGLLEAGRVGRAVRTGCPGSGSGRSCVLAAQLCKHRAGPGPSLYPVLTSPLPGTLTSPFPVTPSHGHRSFCPWYVPRPFTPAPALFSSHHPAFSPPQLPPRSGGYFWALVSPSEED